MDTPDFCTTIAPETLYLALEPITPPDGTGACATHDPTLFDTPRRQQMAFDGEPLDLDRDYPAARAMCTACPMLDACRAYADESGETDTFLAATTPEERAAGRTKKDDIAKRRQRVRKLNRLGAPTTVIADLANRDPSLIRGDLRALQRQGAKAAV